MIHNLPCKDILHNGIHGKVSSPCCCLCSDKRIYKNLKIPVTLSRGMLLSRHGNVNVMSCQRIDSKAAPVGKGLSQFRENFHQNLRPDAVNLNVNIHIFAVHIFAVRIIGSNPKDFIPHETADVISPSASLTYHICNFLSNIIHFTDADFYENFTGAKNFMEVPSSYTRTPFGMRSTSHVTYRSPTAPLILKIWMT